MKKLHLFALLLVTLCTLSLTSCKDDDEDMSPNMALLTSDEWIGEGVYVRNTPVELLLQLGGMGDLADQVDISDWRLKFETNGEVAVTAEGSTGTGNWRFEDNENKLVLIDEDGTEQTFTIKKLTETELNLEANVEDFGVEPDDIEELELLNINTFELRFVKD